MYILGGGIVHPIQSIMTSDSPETLACVPIWQRHSVPSYSALALRQTLCVHLVSHVQKLGMVFVLVVRLYFGLQRLWVRRMPKSKTQIPRIYCDRRRAEIQCVFFEHIGLR
jgi:hypothetical protein